VSDVKGATIGKLVSSRTGWPFAEGDDYHSEANRAKMHSGVPLNDEDRAPWLLSLHEVLTGWADRDGSGILACSALKQAYRDTLTGGLPAGSWRFVLLHLPREQVAERLNGRAEHFMNPALLETQFATLETPSDALIVAAEGTSEETVELVLEGLGMRGQAAPSTVSVRTSVRPNSTAAAATIVGSR
jgi:gluconokinase